MVGAQLHSLEDKCLIFLRQVGVGAAASSAPVTDEAWQLFFRMPAVLEVVYRPDVACCRSPYL